MHVSRACAREVVVVVVRCGVARPHTHPDGRNATAHVYGVCAQLHKEGREGAVDLLWLTCQAKETCCATDAWQKLKPRKIANLLQPAGHPPRAAIRSAGPPVHPSGFSRRILGARCVPYTVYVVK